MRTIHHHVRDNLSIEHDEAIVGEIRDELVVEDARVVHVLGPMGRVHALKVMTLVVRVRPVIVNKGIVHLK